ncbi:MAG: BlaI/MecI/CopY family transcriptional regulator [Candidatus Latescibacterota bacterium]
MARRKSRTFTEVELEFMQIIWERGEAAPDDIEDVLLERGRSVSLGSIRNVLAIMMEKGYLSRRKAGKAYLYRAKVRRDQARTQIIGDILSTMFEGSESLVVAALLENREISPDERDKIRRLLDPSRNHDYTPALSDTHKENRHES